MELHPWGFQFIPRIGMEVVVTFLEGDPDRPLVTGCVYNGENHVPYAQPSEKTRSGIKTNSSKTTGGYNEIRFEDRAGEEQVYVQAQRNMDTLVKNDQTLTVGRNRTKLVKGRERNTIVQDRMTLVKGNESKDVEGNQETGVHGPVGASLHVDNCYAVAAGVRADIVVGNSTIAMTPDSITLLSKVINIFAGELVDIRGGIVRINCEPPPRPSAQYDEAFVLRDTETGNPLADVSYRIVRASGSVIEGKTDKQGRTALVETDEPENLELYVEEDATDGEDW